MKINAINYQYFPNKIRSFRSFYSQSDLFRNGAYIYIIAVLGMNFTAVFFHLFVSRIIGPSKYGLVGSMIGILSVLLVPINALQVSVTQATLRSNTEEVEHKPSIRKLLIISFFYSSIIAGIIALFAPTVNGYLSSPTPTPFLLITAWIPIATATCVLQGYLVADLKFKEVGIATFFGNGIFRLIVAVLMVSLGFGVSGAMFGIVIAQVMTLVILVSSSASLNAFAKDSAEIKLKFGESVLPIFGFSGLTIFIGIDMFYSRHVLSHIDSGLYSAAATTAHLTFLVPATLGTIVFPFIAGGRHNTNSGRKVFRQLLLITISSEVLIFIIIMLFPKFLLNILFGPKYHGGSTVLSTLSLESLFIGISMTLFTLLLAKNSLLTQFVWAPVLLAGALLPMNPHTLHSIAETMVIVSLLTCLLFTILNYEHFRKPQILPLE